MENLWSTAFENAKDKISPLQILKDQASQLGSMTKNLVRAEVRMKRDPSSSKETSLIFDFNILASLFNNYRYRLFTAGIDISAHYPLVLFLPFKLKAELLGSNEEKQGNDIVVNSEIELLDWLRRIFSSEFTLNIISSLVQITERGDS